MRTLLAVLLALALATAFVFAWQSGFVERLSDPEQLAQEMRQSGWKGPLICIAIQFAQVVIFLIPGEITQIAAGYVFGPWLGFAYSVVGIVLGAAFNFGFARFVGRPVITKMLGRPTMAKVDRLLESGRGKSALFVVFLIPGMPKDALSYGAGLSSYPITQFLTISGLARTPALLFSTVIGGQISERNWIAMGLTIAVGIAVTVIFYFYRRRLLEAS